MDFCLFVSATVIASPKTNPKGCFVLIVCLFYFFSKTQNFRDDALLVQEVYSFIHGLLNKCFQPVSLTDYFPLPPTYPSTTPYIVTFASGDLRVAAIKLNKLLKKRNVVYTSFIRPF